MQDETHAAYLNITTSHIDVAEFSQCQRSKTFSGVKVFIKLYLC